MPKNARKDISTEALLRMGGIKGLLDEVNGTQPTDSNVEGPALVLDDFEDEEEKPLTKENASTVSTDTKGKEHKKAGKEAGRKPKVPKTHDGDSGRKAPKQNHDKEKATSKKVNFLSEGKFSSDDWDKILSLMNDYHHAIDRDNDKTVFIEGDIMAVLRSCLGHRTSRFINVILRIFIESNKDRFKALHSKQCRLLK